MHHRTCGGCTSAHPTVATAISGWRRAARGGRIAPARHHHTGWTVVRVVDDTCAVVQRGQRPLGRRAGHRAFPASDGDGITAVIAHPPSGVGRGCAAGRLRTVAGAAGHTRASLPPCRSARRAACPSWRVRPGSRPVPLPVCAGVPPGPAGVTPGRAAASPVAWAAVLNPPATNDIYTVPRLAHATA